MENQTVTMKELYDNCKNIILKNYGSPLDDNVLDILTVVSLSLYLRFPEIALKKIPFIFNKIEIIFEDKPVSEMVLEKYDNYPWNNFSDSNSAMVIRALNVEEDIDEDWTMFINLSGNNDLLNTLSKTIHEMIHLLRFGGIYEYEKEIKIRDGIGISRCVKETASVKRKHFYAEEGIVEYFTKDTITYLYENIKNESDLSFSPTLNSFKKKFNGQYSPCYLLHVSLFEGLALNPRIKRYMEESFEVTDDIPSLITYYNQIIGNSGAFGELSRGLDKLQKTIYDNNQQETINIINSLKPAIAKVINSYKNNSTNSTHILTKIAPKHTENK